MEINQYSYKTKNGDVIIGKFDIYQGRDGKIYLMLGENAIDLNLSQIEVLKINLYSLNYFIFELFKKAYNIESNEYIIKNRDNFIRNRINLNSQDIIKNEPIKRKF